MSVITCFTGKVTAFALEDSAEIIMEVNSKRVLYSKNENVKKYMASTTKILTAITTIENIDLDEKVTVTGKTVGIEGSSIYLEAGEVLTVKDLLYGLMLRSGNDCAETLALKVGESLSGNRDTFISLMNKTAEKIGAKSSHFTNPHGLHDDNHYTTAYDLALISAYAMQNDVFREIVGTKSVYIPFTTRNTRRFLKNKNKLLFNLEGATGIKTGFTKKAGRCLVSSKKVGDLELICVVLNCPPMFERSVALLDYYTNNYSNYKLIESDEIVGFADTGTDDKCGLYVKNDVILPLTKQEKEKIKIEYEYPDKIVGIKKDTEVGTVKIFIENNLIFSEKIYTIIDT